MIMKASGSMKDLFLLLLLINIISTSSLPPQELSAYQDLAASFGINVSSDPCVDYGVTCTDDHITGLYNCFLLGL